MQLVIVESPAKAKTIESFLGKDFTVKSSYGHVRDLAKKGVAIDVEKNFEPNYEVLPDKKKVIAELKSLSKKAEFVWLATDEDREGEAISWHLFEELKLKEEKTRRIVFHEITKKAIQKALENPRAIDKNLVDAQQARRVLDRLVGFELSPVLWRKVKPSLSAGRVQSVTVRLIVEREKEINDFNPVSSFKVVGNFKLSDGTKMQAEVKKKFADIEEAKTLISSCNDAQFSISNLEKKPGKRTPAAPFTTSTLQQEASRKLGFSVSQTMSVAQKLYESGKITYMRTDSVSLSDFARGTAKEVITSQYGNEYHNHRNYTTKSKGAQEAHEAIRPTDMSVFTAGSDSAAKRLYELIHKRTLATQMADAILEKTTATLSADGVEHTFVAQGEVIKFDGFLKVYRESSDDENEAAPGSKLLPPLSVGESLETLEIIGSEKFSKHPPRYTEAALVKQLEQLGIGRPSTYAPTISTIQKRGYVVKEDREGDDVTVRDVVLAGGIVEVKERIEHHGRETKKLFPTDIGIVVTDFLVDKFGNILNYGFTAEVESEFDKIAEGLKKWNDMIDKFYGPFHKNVSETMETAEKAVGERLLGDDPKTGKPIYAKIGRYGPMVQLGSTESEEKPKFAGIPDEYSLQSVTLEVAIDLFKLPRDLGEYDGKKVSAGVGRYGPFVRFANEFVSLGEKDPISVTFDEAVELYKAKQEEKKSQEIKTFDANPDIRVLNGRYGPYIKAGKKNVKIPKDKNPEDLTLEECVELAEKAPVKKRRTVRKKK